MTAVEWLINEFHKKQNKESSFVSYNHIFDKAKEMEMEQQANKYSKEEVIGCVHEYFIYRIDEDIKEKLPFSKWLETYKKD